MIEGEVVLVKQCTQCFNYKSASDFNKNKMGRYGLRSYCKVCESIKNKERYIRNIDKRRLYHKNYYAKNKDKCREAKRQWTAKNKTKVRAYEQLKEKKERIQLADNYVKKLLVRDETTLKREDIPKEIIEIKRLILLINREIKEKS